MSELGLVDPRLLRSVRIEHDWYSADPSRDYVLGSAAVDTIREVLPATDRGPRGRAFTLTGPYGTGKSALALFLADLLGGDVDRRSRARERFASVTGIAVADRRFLPVLITCRSAPIETLIKEGCENASVRAGIPTTAGFRELVDLALTSGYDGVLLVLDELGKALEFAAKEPLLADPFLLQDLAELAARNEFPVLVIGVLHQSFSGYSEGLDMATRNEWTKIQGRFRDLTFLPPEETLARLIAESIGGIPSDTKWLDSIACQVRSLPDIWPSFMPEEAFEQLCRKSWPLHPLTVAALPVLMRRFGQNERSLFAFLVERGLLVDRRTPKTSVRLCDLFEHVSEWIGHGGRSPAAARRWRLALELLYARPGLDNEERDVLRTVALITALGRFAPFNATTEAVSLALGSKSDPILDRLATRSAIVHRRHLGAWVLWEGSDVDLDGLLDAARLEVAGRVDHGRLLLESGAIQAGIAQRHYEETGTLRWFRPMVFTDPDAIDLPPISGDPSNGILALGLGATPSAQNQFGAWADSLDRPDVIVAVVHRAPVFRKLAEELEAVQQVERTAPELRGDRVAREELAARRAALTSSLATEAERLLDPAGPDGCVFYRSGMKYRVETRRGLTRCYSEACDELFAEAPLLRNELINRRALSSAAAAARRDLLQAMLERSEEPSLGYGDGYPPDRAMYESLLRESGLHREVEPGQWGFASPPEDDKLRIRPIWRHLEERLFGNFPEPIRVDALGRELQERPFGLVNGPFPLLLAAFLLAHREDTALYREGVFIPEMGIAHWELLSRRPEFFAVAGCRQSGARKQVLELVCGRLGVEPPKLMPAVRFVIKTIDNLPARARATKDVKPTSSAMRTAALEARSPEVFFFHDLPKALDLAPLGDNEDERAANQFLARLRESLQDLADVVPKTRSWARARLAEAAGFPPDDEGFNQLRQSAGEFRDRMDDPKARDLCIRLMATDAEAAEVGALALVAMRPVETWTDADRDNFVGRAEAITRELRRDASRGGALPDRDLDLRADKLAVDLLKTLKPSLLKDRITLLAALKRLVKQIEEETTNE